VLRRENVPRYRFEKSLFAAFEAAVRSIPDAQIVVTSTWREVLGLTGLRKLFSPDVGGADRRRDAVRPCSRRFTASAGGELAAIVAFYTETLPGRS
jgi:hypothetical protein